MNPTSDPVAFALSILRGQVPPTEPVIEDELAELDRLEQAAQLELAELDRDAALLSLFEFVKQGWHILEPFELEASWHHEALCANVQGMFEEWLKHRDDKTYEMQWHKLLINICPSSLKSRIIMVFALAWMWLRCPSFQFFCTSVNPNNVSRDSSACRDLVTSKWYRETFKIKWSIRPDMDSIKKWATTAGGVRISLGLQAKFTGIHVDGILIDDPDDAHDVHSDAKRLFRAGKIESLSSRLNDKRAYVMISSQQRVHVDDHTADQLARGGSLHANYALEYHERTRHDSPFYTDPRKTDGENLHPVRFTTTVIAEARVELGTHGFEAQYNGNPSPLEGGMVPRIGFRFFKIAGEAIGPCNRPTGCWTGETYTLERLANGQLNLDWVTITIDATFGSTSATADGVGILVMGGKGVQRFIFADETKPMSYPETKKRIRELIKDYPDVTRILVEKAAAGDPLIQDLELEFAGMMGLGVRSDKKVRCAAMSPAIEAGTVFLLEGATWLDDFITEVCIFPNGKHDDRVDALSQLMAFYRESTDVMKLQAKAAAFKSMANNPRLRMALQRLRRR